MSWGREVAHGGHHTARYNALVRRRLLNLLTALSLLLCVAVCVLWVRSYWRYDSK